MRVDLHNHTKLCNHATGEIEDYVKKAIKEEIDIFGFSDHAPMEFDKKYRMSLEECNWYENEVKRVKERYKKKIEILIGYEVDYLPGFLEDRVLKAKVDYLIGSIHFLRKDKKLWGFDNIEFIGEYKNSDIDKIYEDYFLGVKEMANSSLFQIAAHLDLIKVFNFKPKKDIRIIAKEAINAIKRANMAVEINAAGFRKPVKEPYPSKELLELIYEKDIPITFASDAHSTEHIGFKKDKIKELAKSVGFTKQAIFKKKQMQLLPL
jgi:histidinol-phosphatase (PHP family)